MKNSRTRRIAISAMIAAIYAALTIVLAPIAYGSIQFRVSEALTVLPFVAPDTAWGLFVGCIIANIFNPAGINLLDVVFGSLATLLSALITAKCRSKWLAPLPPVLINGVVVGAVLAYTYARENFWVAFPLFGAEVAVGEAVVCYILGVGLLYTFEKTGLDKRIR